MAKAKKKFHLPKIPSWTIILFLVSVVILFITYQNILKDKYYPFTFVGSSHISLLSRGQAIRTVEGEFKKRLDSKLEFGYPQGSFIIDTATASASLDYSALESHFKEIHEGTFLSKIESQLQSLILSSKISPKISLNLNKQLDKIASSVDKMPTSAQITFDETTNSEGSPSANIAVKEDQDGYSLDKEALIEIIQEFLLTGKYKKELPIKIDAPKVTTAHAQKAKKALEDTLKEPLKLQFENANWTIDAKALLPLLDLQSGQNLLEKNQTNLYLEQIAQEIDQEVQEGLFEFNPNTKRVTAFKPSQEGRKLNIDKAYDQLTEGLKNNTKVVNLSVEIVKPKIHTSDVNSLGIQELIGRGVSHFSGSITNRIYNIGHTARKINGVLVPPGEIFSFNQTVGDITAATGFKQAYVIKEGRTVLDDGGGVCQDSTTLFRAVLNAGLPVVKRTAHAYRVGYYEQGFPPGLDATVYYPSVDFQFKNDSHHHILIQAYISGSSLYVDLYGTSDGRQVTLTKPVISSQTPPPPELRQDDPTLPRGTVKQVDWAAWGANVSFQRTITKDGVEVLKETWRSSYKPWQAVYLIGTKEN